MKRIALTGAHGVGKTTLAKSLINILQQHGISVDLTPEIPRIICDLAKDDTFFRRGSNTALKQALLLYTQIQFEYEKSRDELNILVCDRSLLDHWAYTKYFFTSDLEQDGVLDLYEHFISNYCRTYDELFYVPIEFPPIDDGIRESDEEFQSTIDRIIFGILSKDDLPYTTITGTREERCEQVIAKLGLRGK